MRPSLVLVLGLLVLGGLAPWGCGPRPAGRPDRPGVAGPRDAQSDPDASADEHPPWAHVDDGEHGIAFEYPADWQLVRDRARGLLPGERLSIRVVGGPATAFVVAVYGLEAPARDGLEREAVYGLDEPVVDWIDTLPSGELKGSADLTVDGAPAREYRYRFALAGRPVTGYTVVVPRGDRAYEISHWAPEEEADDRLGTFDAIFASLRLPWSP